jgi:hypothetical protein
VQIAGRVHGSRPVCTVFAGARRPAGELSAAADKVRAFTVPMTNELSRLLDRWRRRGVGQHVGDDPKAPQSDGGGDIRGRQSG